MEESENNNLVIGCYSDGKEAPSLFYFDAKEKKAEAVMTQINPSYVVKSQDHYYAVTEHTAGLLVTLNSKFQVLSRIQTLGDDPCHLSMDNTGNFIVACNYSSGSVLICKLTDHKPSSVYSFITHEGSSVNPERQSSPHPHSSIFSEDNDVLFVADLGTDIIYYYEFTPEKLIWHKEKSIRFEGTGPRTLCRGKPGSKVLYLSCELDNTIRVLSYQNSKLEQIIAYKVSQTELNYPSQVCYLNNRIYLGLRGEDKVMIFEEKEEGKLQQFCTFKVGEWPRHLSVTPSGYLYVACQKGNLVEKYKISQDKIVLHSQLSMTTPSCVIVV